MPRTLVMWATTSIAPASRLFGGIEQGDVAGRRGDRDRRAGGVAGQDAGLLDVAFAGAAGEAEGEEGGGGRFGL